MTGKKVIEDSLNYIEYFKKIIKLAKTLIHKVIYNIEFEDGTSIKVLLKTFNKESVRFDYLSIRPGPSSIKTSWGYSCDFCDIKTNYTGQATITYACLQNAAITRLRKGDLGLCIGDPDISPVLEQILKGTRKINWRP